MARKVTTRDSGAPYSRVIAAAARGGQRQRRAAVQAGVQVLPSLVIGQAGQAGQRLGARAPGDGQRAAQVALLCPGQERAEVPGDAHGPGWNPLNGYQ